MNLTKVFKEMKFKCKQNAPEILLGTGIVVGACGVVLACYGTTKIKGIMDSRDQQLNDIEEALAINAVDEDGIEYSMADAAKDEKIIAAQTTLKIMSAYAPAMLVLGLSTGCILASHNVIKKRNLALSAAYTGLDTSFKAYRARVKKAYGEEAEQDIRLNRTRKTVETEVTDEKGETKKVEEEVVEYGRFIDSTMAIFDEENPLWERGIDYNLMILKQAQDYWNNRLQIDGRVFLCDILKELGLEDTKEAHFLGWKYDKEKIYKIDFGIFTEGYIYKNASVDKVHNIIILDFNVDGDILTNMK